MVPDTPVRVRWYALVTQLVECDTCNIEVAGSNPVGGSLYLKGRMQFKHYKGSKIRSEKRYGFCVETYRDTTCIDFYLGRHTFTVFW